ncbi:MAG: sigma-54 dependent transcriptional regulator [Methylococcaceae bacterium]
MNKIEGTATILVADDDPTNLDVLLACLNVEGYRVLVAEDGESAVEQSKHALPDLILLDVLMPSMDGYEACRALKLDETTHNIPVIFMTALDNLDSKIRAFELGAADYITKPFRHEEVQARVATQLSLTRISRELEVANNELEKRVIARTAELTVALDEVRALKSRLQTENAYLQEEIRQHHGQHEIIGSSNSLKNIIANAKRVAPSTTTVLICGETGTGKELLARTVHEYSLRGDRPLVKLNCAAISGGLVESELFGHVKGAFTGAVDKRSGRFEIAHGGTLFLDEISELPLETQAKLLRVLQEQEFEPVGSSKTRKVDVRIIAATNRDLPAEIKNGRFRSDLYFRLNVFPLEIPPLRHRSGDVEELAVFFLERFARKHHKSINNISKRCMEKLRNYDWPGNIRDLQNVIERAVILCDREELDIPWRFDKTNIDELEPQLKTAQELAAPSSVNGDLALHEIERQHIITILKKTNGVISGPNGAAVLLELKPGTTRFRIKKLGISKSDYLA